jgi:hypothetical protein
MERESYFLNIEYRFTSGLGSLDVLDCITQYKAEIHAEHFSEKAEYEYVGEIVFKIINLGGAHLPV